MLYKIIQIKLYEKGKKKRRQILWFNRPYSCEVITNFGKQFFNLLQKHFPKSHKYHKFINKNSVKMSYSCLRNMEQIIKAHTKKVLQDHRKQEVPKLCNCRNSDLCPLEGECLTTSVVYEATLTTDDAEKHTYIGVTEDTFKKRWTGHKSTFKNNRYRTATKLSEKV